MIVYRCIGQKTRYKSDLVKIYIEKVKRKENGQIGDFDVAPILIWAGFTNLLTKMTKRLK